MASAWDQDDHNWQRYELSIEGQLVEYSESVFDADGKRIGENTFEGDGTKAGSIKNSFNDQGKLVKSEDLNLRGKLEEVTTYTYDDQGRKLREEIANRRGKLQEYTTYEYDAAGKVAMLKTHNAKGRVSLRGEYSHSQGKTTVTAYEEDDRQPAFTIVHQYNSKGDMYKSSLYEGDDTGGPVILSFTYSY